MIKDAEQNEQADQEFQDMVQAVNQAEQLIHGTEKALKDLGDGVDANQKTQAEEAMTALKAAIEAKDKADIEAKTEALSKISGEIAQQAYQKAQPEGEQPQDEQGDQTVDAEFDEVDEQK